MPRTVVASHRGNVAIGWLRTDCRCSCPTLGPMTDRTEVQADSQETLGGRADPNSSASKDPAEWVTGDEPMTGAQRSYLDTLAREAGEEISADLTKAEASEHIDRLQGATGRGQ